MQEFAYIVDLMKIAVEDAQPIRVTGRVLEVKGIIIKAVVPAVKLGEICILHNPDGSLDLQAEVVGFTQNAALLTPIGDMYGVSTITEVTPTGRTQQVAVGPGLLGRVLDGLGRPLDVKEKGPLQTVSRYPVYADPPDPLQRRMIKDPMPLGVRALDGMLTCGEGQRLGIFAAAGGGKSTLLSMLVKGAEVDVTVMALIGERGREVREFIEHDLGPEGMAKSVIVVATSDKSSMERAKAAYVATSIAEYFRDQGQRVLFLMDSVTRFARAQREIGLAAGEPPTRRGFPPSVFATLPKLMERVGMNDKGSITAFYTVLVEGDDMNEPVADETRSILDGHIILSRKLASANRYPAIDVLASASRTMNFVTTPEHQQPRHAACANCWPSTRRSSCWCVSASTRRAPDKVADEAIDKERVVDQLPSSSRTSEKSDYDKTIEQLGKLV